MPFAATYVCPGNQKWHQGTFPLSNCIWQRFAFLCPLTKNYDDDGGAGWQKFYPQRHSGRRRVAEEWKVAVEQRCCCSNQITSTTTIKIWWPLWLMVCQWKSAKRPSSQPAPAPVFWLPAQPALQSEHRSAHWCMAPSDSLKVEGTHLNSIQNAEVFGLNANERKRESVCVHVLACVFVI